MDADRTIHRMARVLSLLGLFALLSTVAEAQPALNIRRVVLDWPTVEVYVAAACQGRPSFDLDASNFRLFEDGAEISGFSLQCPDPNIRCPFSVAMVFDASESMRGGPADGAMEGAAAFIDRMDGVTDRASFMTFHDSATVVQNMTADKADLYAAASTYMIGTGTHVWDAGYAGVQNVVNAGNATSCRAVIFLVDGADTGSVRQPNEIYELAQDHHIRVFTIGLGPDKDHFPRGDLEAIALQTGGRYYETPNAANIDRICEDIAVIVMQSFHECTLTYQSSCADGSWRRLRVELTHCDDVAVKERPFRAEDGVPTMTDLHMKLGEVSATSAATVTVPLDLVSIISPERALQPLSFTLGYDASRLAFDSVDTPPGSLLENVLINTTPGSGSVDIQVTRSVPVQGSGRLMDFIFDVVDPDATDSVTLAATNAVMHPGCFTPVIDDGGVRLNLVATGVDAPEWPAAFSVYPDPNQGSVRLSASAEQPVTWSVTVTNLLGQQVWHRDQGAPTRSFEQNIDLRGAPPGMYLLLVTGGRESWTRTMLRQ